jgi:hypothetical protein
MSGFRWSRLYPRSWQVQFGEEFDAMVSQSPLRIEDKVDILFHAGVAQLQWGIRLMPFLLAWIGIGTLNIVASEVQWAAGMLLLCSGIAAFYRPRFWLKYTLLFTVAVPISSLYFYQIPNIPHEPLYKTAVALLPSLAGALLGLGMRSIVDLTRGGQAE